MSILLKLKMNTASSISDIRYVLIKQANAETQVVFWNFVSECIEKGEILLK